MPHVPAAISRPAGWPTDRPTGTDQHVLSSILPNPGAALQPLDVGPSAGRPQTSGTGVVQAGFEADAASASADGVRSLETAMVVARVGPEVVLEGDLLTPKALEWLDKVSPGLTPEQVRQLRLQICRQVMDQHIETLLVYVDAMREIPEDKLPEIRQNVDKAFDQQFLPNLMKESGAANSLEFEQSLRAKGQSLDRMRKMFFERGLSQEWMRKNTQVKDEIPHAEMIAWYRDHLADYDYPAQARYEALTVKKGLKRSQREAWNMLAEMGNEVLAGRPFAEVAKSRSEGPTAAEGGIFDWTTKGSLAAKNVDDAIFSLPVGQLSSIVEDGDTAVHIVRVIERRDAGRIPFLEAQVQIRQTLLDDRRRKAVEDYLARLRERTPVWTAFDDAPGTSPRMARSPTMSR